MEINYTITNAQYYAPDGHNSSVKATINGTIVSVPLDPANTDYAEILRQVEAGDLTIADAD
jgi:hypothetical protein